MAVKRFGLSVLIGLTWSVLILTPILFGAAREPTLVFDPRLSQEQMVPWLAYLGARAVYRKEHKLPSPRSGEIIPTFAEEVSARNVAVGSYLATRAPGKTLPYWETMVKVAKTNFMEEYGWTFLHRKEWPNSASPRNLAGFDRWRISALRNHSPEVRGMLEAASR